MNQDEIRQHILNILHRIAPEADLDHLDANENLRESLDIDSFDFLNVVIGLNEQFGVNIPDADYRQVSTLKGMMEYLSRHISSQTP
jgi:acyl carrier protein